MADDRTTYEAVIKATVVDGDKSTQQVRSLARAVAGLTRDLTMADAAVAKLSADLKKLSPGAQRAFDLGPRGMAIAGARTTQIGLRGQLEAAQASFAGLAQPSAVGLFGPNGQPLPAFGASQQAFEHGAAELSRNRMLATSRARFQYRQAKNLERVGRESAGMWNVEKGRLGAEEGAYTSRRREMAGVVSGARYAKDSSIDAREDDWESDADAFSSGDRAAFAGRGRKTASIARRVERERLRSQERQTIAGMRGLVSGAGISLRGAGAFGGVDPITAMAMGAGGRGFGGGASFSGVNGLAGGGGGAPGGGGGSRGGVMGRGGVAGVWLVRDIAQIAFGVGGGAAQFATAPALHGVAGVGPAYHGLGAAMGGVAGVGLGAFFGLPGMIGGGLVGLGVGGAVGGTYGEILQKAIGLGGQGLDFRRAGADGLFGLNPGAYQQALMTAAQNKGFESWTNPYNSSRTRSGTPYTSTTEHESVANPARVTRMTETGTRWGAWQNIPIEPSALEISLFGIFSRGRRLGYTSQQTLGMMGRVQASGGGWADDASVLDAQHEALLLQRGIGVTPDVTGKLLFGSRRGGFVGSQYTRRGMGGISEGLYQGGDSLGLSGPGELQALFGFAGGRMDDFRATGRRFNAGGFLQDATGLANRGLGPWFGMQAAIGLHGMGQGVAANGPQSWMDVLALRTMGGMSGGAQNAEGLLRAMQNLEGGGVPGGQGRFLAGISASAGGGSAGALLMHLKRPAGGFSIAISRALAAGGGGPFGVAGGEFGTMSLGERAMGQTTPGLGTAADIADTLLRVGIQLTNASQILEQAATRITEKVGESMEKIEAAGRQWEKVAKLLAEMGIP